MTRSPATRTFGLDAESAHIYVTTAGAEADPCLLLIRGFPQTSRTWPKTIAPLVGKGFRLIMPGNRSEGGSSRRLADYDRRSIAADLGAVLDAVSVATIPDAGHWLADENPVAVVDALATFAAKTRGAM
jgi:pimeloyl-ACP methyl ester carboxylesterase